jgi:iron-sulfur cluster repair protein YtfE (RIC family)
VKLTDALLGEHAVLYGLFDYMRDTVLEGDDMRGAQEAAAILERLLLSHARVEESLLFPRLERHLGPAGPLAVMRDEHRRIDELLAAAREASDLATVKSRIGELLDLAHSHFQKEEQVLFGMARQALGEAALTELGGEWAASRNVTIVGGGCMGAP